MASKNPWDVGDPNIDDFGFDDYDPLSPDIAANNATPMQKALKGAKEGIKETVLTKDTLMRLVKAAVPAGIGRTLDTADDVVGTSADLYNSVAEQLGPTISSLKRNARRIMPKVRDKLPNPLAKAIDGLLADNSTSYSSDYDPDEEAIRSAFRDVFEAQRLVDDEYRAEDEAKAALRDKANDLRAGATVNQLRAIRQTLQQLAIHQDTVATRRDQKLLELQYRQYFTQRDLLVETKRANVDVLDQLKALVENSTMPDTAKANAYAQRVNSGSVLARTRNRVDAYVSDFSKTVRERAARQAKRLASGFKMGLSGINMLASQAGSMGGDFGPSWQELGGQMAGEVATQEAATLLGERLSRYARKIPGVAALNEKLTYFNDNAPELLSEWARKRSNGLRLQFWKPKDPFDFSEGFGASAINQLKSLIPKFYEGTPEFTNKGYTKAREAVSYDDLSRKSLVEIIPGLLSRILRSVDGIRTGRADVAGTRYDIASGGFVTTDEQRGAIHSSLLPKNQTEHLSKQVDGLVQSITRGSKLSDAAKGALKQQLLHNMVMGRRFNPESLSTARGFDQIEDPKLVRELTALFGRLYPRGPDGELSDSVSTRARLNRHSSRYQSIRSSMPSFEGNMSDIIDAGGRDQLRAIGALRRDGLREFLDPSYIVNAILGKTELQPEEALAGGVAPSRAGNTVNVDTDAIVEAIRAQQPTTAQSAPTPGTARRRNRKRRARNTTQPEARTAETVLPTETPEPEIPTTEDPNVDDLYAPGDDDPRLTRLGILAGRYIDQKTRKVIRSLADITGPVIDRSGRVLVSSADLAAGLATGAGVRLKRVGAKTSEWVDRTSYVSRLIGGRVGSMTDAFVQGMVGLRGRIDDVYVLGLGKEPVLQGTKMRAGWYIDQHTNKPIKTIDDIKGGVVDALGNVVLSDDDYERGLYLKDGTLVRRSGLVYNAGRFTRWWFGGYYRNLWKVMKWGARKAAGLASWTGRTLLGVPDVYVPGEDSPRLLSRMLKRGMYLSSKTGRRIYRLSQIDSDVLGPDGDVVLSLEDMKNGLVDKYGKPVKALLPRMVEWLITGSSAPMRFLGRYTRRAYRNMGSATRRVAGVTRDVAGWAIDKTGKILRPGSWQEREAKRQAEALRRGEDPNAKSKDKSDKKDSTPWGAILALAGALKGGFDRVVDKLNPLSHLKDLVTLARGGKLLGDVAGSVGGKGGWIRRGGRAIAKTVGGLGSTVAASSAGAAIATGAGSTMTAIGTGLAAAGSAIVTTLTSPLVLGAVAIAAAGFGAWWLWKKFASTPDPLQAVRLAEYGVADGDRDTAAKVLSLEESLAPYTTVAGDTASFNKDLPLDDILALFDIDKNSPQSYRSFLRWLTLRFKPVYLKFAAKGEQLQRGIKVHELDKKLDDADKPRIARETKFSSESPDYPYNIGDGPNPSQPAVTGVYGIEKAIAAVEAQYGKAEKAKLGKTIAAERNAENAQTASGLNNPLRSKTEAPAMNAPDMRYTTQSSLDKVAADAITAHADVGKALWEAGSSRRIDELAGIRYRTYGLVALDKGRVDTLVTLETDLLKQLTFSADGTASLDYSASKQFELYGPRFQISLADSTQRTQWITWFTDRFMPTLLAYATAVKRCNKSIAIEDAWKLLKAKDQSIVAQAIVGATTSGWFSKTSVWTITASPWYDYKVNTDSSSVREALASLEARIKQETLEEERKSVGAPKVGDGVSPYVYAKNAADQKLANTVNSALSYSGTGALQGVTPVPQSNRGTDAWSLSNGGSLAGQTGQFGEGGGGLYTQLPASKGDGWENNKELLIAASKMSGVDPGIMATFAGIESGFKPGIKAEGGSATGLFQFISSTWNTMLQKYGAKYGIPPGTPPTDARANALMGAEFLRENRDSLSSLLGREPTDVDLYTAHFLGMGGAKKFYGMPGSAIAAQLMPEAANANKPIFYDNGRPRTRDEVMAELTRRVRVKGRPYASAAYALSSGASAGVATVDPEADNTPAENVVSGTGMAPSDSAFTPSSPGVEAAPAASTAPTTSPTAAPISGVAQQFVPTPDAQARTQAQVSARAPAAAPVTNDALIDVLGKQLTVQMEIRELLKNLVNSADDSNGDTSTRPTDTTDNGNDKSADSARRLTLTSNSVGPISLSRTTFQ